MKSLRAVVAGTAIAAAVSCAGLRSGLVPTPLGRSDHVAAGRIATGFETERRWGPVGRDAWEPVTAADPNSNWVYQMTTQQRPNVLLFRASSDGGATWNPERRICRRGIKPHFQFDPQLAVARDGTVDAVCLDNFLPGVVFTQSHDHGRSWSAPVRLDGSRRYSDKPTLVVSASGKDVYVAYNIFFALYVSASHDGGVTWNGPVLATSRHLWYYSYSGTVAPDGSVWFAVDGEFGKNQTGGGSIGLVHSGDGGVTWTTVQLASTHEGEPCDGKNCYQDYFTGEAAVATDAKGAFVFAYARNRMRQGPNALYVRRSSDGQRWSPPIEIATVGNSTSPALASGPQPGDFRLVWQDNRNGAIAWNTWYARSTDGGRSWSTALRLSDRGSGAPYKHRDGYAWPFGDYLGLSVDANGLNHVIWGEGSGVYVPGGTWFTRGN